MKLEDANNGIMIDDEFPCSSAGETRLLAPGSYEVGFQPEEIPQWFQGLLDDLFKGKGVPKEYMAHVQGVDRSQDAGARGLRRPARDRTGGHNPDVRTVGGGQYRVTVR